MEISMIQSIFYREKPTPETHLCFQCNKEFEINQLIVYVDKEGNAILICKACAKELGLID